MNDPRLEACTDLTRAPIHFTAPVSGGSQSRVTSALEDLTQVQKPMCTYKMHMHAYIKISQSSRGCQELSNLGRRHSRGFFPNKVDRSPTIYILLSLIRVS